MPAFLNLWTVDFRPNTSVQFYENSQSFLDHIQTKYIQPGILLQREREVSFDGLEETITYRWEIPSITESYLIHEAVSNDATLIENAQARAAYNQEHGILTSNLFYEVRDSTGNVFKRDEFPLEMAYNTGDYYLNKKDQI